MFFMTGKGTAGQKVIAFTTATAILEVGATAFTMEADTSGVGEIAITTQKDIFDLGGSVFMTYKGN